MKKFFQLAIISALLVFGIQTAFANTDKVNVVEDADLTIVHRLAINAPLYSPVAEDAPSKDELTNIIYKASKVSNIYVISYDEIAANIRRDIGIDIKALERRKAAKIFGENIGKYADAYVTPTVANSSKLVMFFEVSKASNHSLLFDYQIKANRSEKETADTFKLFAEQFYKNLDKSIKHQEKENTKKFLDGDKK